MIRREGKKKKIFYSLVSSLSAEKKMYAVVNPNSRNYNYVILLAVIITFTSPVCAARRFDSSGSVPGSSYLSIVEEQKGSVEG